jgi:hypothetical protein
MEMPNMHSALIKHLTFGVSPQGEIQRKQYQYCLCWA